MKLTRQLRRTVAKYAVSKELPVFAVTLMFGVLATGSALSQITYPSTGEIKTIGGNGVFGYSGNGGLATSAELRNPDGVAIDGAGNVFFVDSTNQVVREINAATGIISTVAGNGTEGYSGDGGPATSAQLASPCGLAVDFAGNIYIADMSNHVIREVSTSSARQVRLITTIAGNGTLGSSGNGGPATSAELMYPTGVAVDGAGNIYIADETGGVIRMVSASTGVISTVAGNGTYGYSGDGGLATGAAFSYPMDVAVDGAGNIYIADTYNARVRKVTASTGKISTLAGDGTAGYSGDGGLATSAELNQPMGLAIDTGGNVYIADYMAAVVRKVTTSTGDIVSLAGDGTSGYSGDGGQANLASLRNPARVAVDTSGHTIIADMSNNRVRAVTGTPPAAPPPPPTLVQTPYESAATVTINGTPQGGTSISTLFTSITTVTLPDGTVIEWCNVACAGIQTNPPGLIPAANTAANTYTIGYKLTVQDATAGAEIYYNILENGVSHSGSVASGGVISFSVPGGTTLTGTMYATANGNRSQTNYLSF
jgi:sugar lactone lactonase YvrE